MDPSTQTDAGEFVELAPRYIEVVREVERGPAGPLGVRGEHGSVRNVPGMHDRHYRSAAVDNGRHTQ